MQLFKQCHCFLSVDRFAQLKTKRVQELPEQETVLGLVFDNQQPVPGLPLTKKDLKGVVDEFDSRYLRRQVRTIRKAG
jgi:hypothetical protein